MVQEGSPPSEGGEKTPDEGAEGVLRGLEEAMRRINELAGQIEEKDEEIRQREEEAKRIAAGGGESTTAPTQPKNPATPLAPAHGPAQTPAQTPTQTLPQTPAAGEPQEARGLESYERKKATWKNAWSRGEKIDEIKNNEERRRENTRLADELITILGQINEAEIRRLHEETRAERRETKIRLQQKKLKRKEKLALEKRGDYLEAELSWIEGTMSDRFMTFERAEDEQEDQTEEPKTGNESTPDKKERFPDLKLGIALALDFIKSLPEKIRGGLTALIIRRGGLERAMQEVEKLKDPSIEDISRAVLKSVFETIDTLPESKFPGLHEFKRTRPDEFERLKNELPEAILISDKGERGRRVKEILERAGFAGEELKKGKALAESASKIYAKIRNTKLTPEERKKIRQNLNEMESAATGSLGRAQEKLGPWPSLFLAIFLIGVILSAIFLIKMTDKALGGKKGK